VITPGSAGHCDDVNPVPECPGGGSELDRKLEALVEEHVDFVWRALRSLGVRRSDCDDGGQKVWWVVARKLSAIEPGKERSFIFSVVVRVASEMRRSAERVAALPLDVDLPSREPAPEELCDQIRARALLAELLEGMPWEQRVVFVMFELEGSTSLEIAAALDLPRGTVASRLRLAREYFERALSRHQLRQQSLRPRPLSRSLARPEGPLAVPRVTIVGACNE
jgi:RNA polymerase sigma-70 factor (ECF subfamily)